jgi:hypothetical protein
MVLEGKTSWVISSHLGQHHKLRLVEIDLAKQAHLVKPH